MATIDELLTANLHRVFGNRDAGSRRRAVDETYSEDVAFTDPDETVRGRDALDAKAARLLADAPADWVFAEEGPAYVDATTGVQGWGFGPAGSPVVRGVDILTVADGVVTAVRTILAPAPERR